jgi:class 3 adenylate cyclase
MAVVVDRAFFDSIGEMDHVADISNADIAWFVVRFEEESGAKRSRMVLDEVRYTTLERSVEGLTGGKPVPKHEFEKRIAGKLKEAPTLVQADVEGLTIPEELPEQL